MPPSSRCGGLLLEVGQGQAATRHLTALRALVRKPFVQARVGLQRSVRKAHSTTSGANSPSQLRGGPVRLRVAVRLILLLRGWAQGVPLR